MRYSLIIIAAITLVSWSLPTAAQSAGSLRLAPASPWAVDYEEESCALRRTFSSGADQVVLELRAFGIDSTFEVTVASALISNVNGVVRTRFEPDEAYSRPRTPLFLSAGSLHAVRYTDSLRLSASKEVTPPMPNWPDNERDTRERTVNALSITGIAQEEVTLEIGPMNQPMAALRTCVDDLLQQWQLVPSIQRSLSRNAKPIDQMAWARRTQQGLPREVITAGGSGSTSLRLMIGSDGRVSSCAPLRSTGAAAFEKFACDTALRYGRFEPALDAQGQPVGTVFTSTVSYEIQR